MKKDSIIMKAVTLFMMFAIAISSSAFAEDTELSSETVSDEPAETEISSVPSEEQQQETFIAPEDLINNFILKNAPVTINAGDTVTQKIVLESSLIGSSEISELVVDMLTDKDLSVFPFILARSTYRWSMDDMDIQNNTFSFDLSMTSRGDAAQDYYYIPFRITYMYGNNSKTEDVNLPILIITSQSEQTDVSVPRLSVSSYYTSPETVIAGDKFSLSVNIRNTSSSSAVSNVKIRFNGTGMVPDGTASSIIVDYIGPDSSKAVNIPFKALGDIASGSYAIDLEYSFYYGSEGKTGSDSDRLTISVIQQPKAEIMVSSSSKEVYINSMANISLSINNLGRTVLRNVYLEINDPKEVFESKTIFIGDIPAGSYSSNDVLLPALKAGETTLSVSARYEDDLGDSHTVSESLTLFAIERAMQIEDAPVPDAKEGAKKNILVYIILWALGLVAAVSVVIYLVIRHRRNKDKYYS